MSKTQEAGFLFGALLSRCDRSEEGTIHENSLLSSRACCEKQDFNYSIVLGQRKSQIENWKPISNTMIIISRTSNQAFTVTLTSEDHSKLRRD